MDRIEIDYVLEGEAIDRCKIIFSNDYEYWYSHSYDIVEENNIDNIVITGLNARIDNKIYENITSIYINGKKESFFNGYDFGVFVIIKDIESEMIKQ